MIRYGVFGTATIDMMVHKAGIIAEVLMTAQAVAACTASPAEPGYSDAVSDRERLSTGLHYGADDMVSRDQGKFRAGKFSVNDV